MRALLGRLYRVARFGTSTAANFAEAGAQEATSSSAAQSAQLQALHKPYSEVGTPLDVPFQPPRPSTCPAGVRDRLPAVQGGWFKRHSGVPIAAFLSGGALGLAGGVYGGSVPTGCTPPVREPQCRQSPCACCRKYSTGQQVPTTVTELFRGD